MSRQYRDLDAADVQSYLDSVQTQANAPAQESPTGAGNAANAEAERILDQRLRAQESAKAIEVKSLASQGAVTEVNPITGKKDLVTHADGGVKFEPGLVGDVKPVSQTQTQPDYNVMLGGGEEGAAGAGMKSLTTQYGQETRDDRGNVTTKPVTPVKDPKTGRSYVERTDPTNGAKVKVLAEVDAIQQQKIARKMQLDDEDAAVTMKQHGMERHKLAFEPKWQPIDKAFTEASKDYETHAKGGFTRVGEKWEKLDPKTGKPTFYDPDELAYWLKQKDEKKNLLTDIETQRNALLPQFDQITTAEKEIAKQKQDIAARKSRLEYGLPADDGGAAELIARAKAGEQVTVRDMDAARLKELGLDPDKILGKAQTIQSVNEVVAEVFAPTQTAEQPAPTPTGGEPPQSGTAAPTPAAASSTVIPFEEWKAKQPVGTDPVAPYQGYADHLAIELAKSGRYTDEAMAAVKGKLFEEAIRTEALPAKWNKDGTLANGEELWALFEPELGNGKRNTNATADAIRNATNSGNIRATHGLDEDTTREVNDAARALALLQSKQGKEIWGDNEAGYTGALEQAQARLNAAAPPETLAKLATEGTERGLREGSIPFAAFPAEEGTRIEVSPSMLQYANDPAAIAKVFEDDPTLDRRFLGAVIQQLTTPEGYKAPLASIMRQADFAQGIQTAMEQGKDPMLEQRLSGHIDAYSKRKDGKVGNREWVREHVIYSLPQEIRDNFSDEEQIDFFQDLAKRQAAPGHDEKNPIAGAYELSTGEWQLPTALILDAKSFEKVTSGNSPIPEAQRKALIKNRPAMVEAQAPALMAVFAAQPSDEGKEAFLAFRERMEDEGKTTAEIVDAWANDPKNHSVAMDYAGGIKHSIWTGFGSLALAPMALAGNEWATNKMAQWQKTEQQRKAYAAAFGENLGIGYDVSTMIVPVVADLLITRGAATIATTAAKTAARSAFGVATRTMTRNVVSSALSTNTKGLIARYIQTGAAKELTRAGFTAGQAGRQVAASSVDDVIKLAGKDFARSAQSAINTSAVMATSFNRSAGMTYVALHEQLRSETNKDGSLKYTPKEVREIALKHGLIAGVWTSLVVGGFQAAGMAGIENFAFRSMTPKQAAQVAANMAKKLGEKTPVLASQAAVREALAKMTAQAVGKGLFMRLGGSTLHEGAEEFIDELGQQINEAFALQKDFNIVEAVKSAGYAGLLGMALGGVVSGAAEVKNAITGTAAISPADEADARRDMLGNLANRMQSQNMPVTAEMLQGMAQDGISEEMDILPEQAIGSDATAPDFAPAAAQPISQPVESGAQGDPATGGGDVPPHVSGSGLGNPSQANAPNAPAMAESWQYEAAREKNPALPEIPSVVQQAFDSGQPVSASMATASGIEIPDGYQKQGAAWVNPSAQAQSTPAQAQTGNPADTGIPAQSAPEAPAKAKSPAQSVAEQVKANVEASMPALKGRITIQEEADGSGGAILLVESGMIRLSVADIERAIESANGDAGVVAAYLENIVAKHEAVHVVQTEALKADWEAAKAAGYTGTFMQFYESFYTELADEVLTPEAIDAARKIYGKAKDETGKEFWHFDKIPSRWQQAAEFTRMLVEAKIDGNTEDFSELFRAVKRQGAKSKLANLIRKAIEILKGMKLSAAAEAHVAKLQELYDELTATPDTNADTKSPEAPATPTSTGKKADTNADMTPGLRIEASGDKARILDGKAVLWQGDAASAPAALEAMQAAAQSPARITGEAIAEALVKFPKLAGKLRKELEAAAEEIMDDLEVMPPADRIAGAQRAIADRINQIADREAERTGKKREEVIEGFRAVAGKSAAKKAASIEAAVIGTEAPAIPEGKKEQRDTPNSEMTVDVVSTFVDLDQLVGSSDPLFPGGALQPRNRSTQASRNQREEMVQNIRDKDDQHRRYVEGSTTDSGRMVISPLFGADGTHMTNEAGKPLFYVVSGNGRRNALAEASTRKVSGKIEKGFRDTAATEGINVEGMTLPVPVSVFVPDSAKAAIDLAEYSNRDAQLSVTNTEQAKRDSASIEAANILKLWEPDAAGDAAAASNRGFVKAFARAVGDEGILDQAGNLTEEGAKRIERAMVAMLLGDGQSAMMEILFNRTGELGLRAILGGIASETGSLLKLAASKPDFDLSPVLAGALVTAVQAKSSLAGGEIRDVSEFFEQGNLFESTDNTTPERQLARALVESRSRKAVREILGAYLRGAEAVDTSTMSMFAEAETSREDLIAKALEARPVDQVITEVAAEFGQNADLPAKLRVIAAGVKRLTLEQRKAMNAAIGAEVERLRDGVVSATEYQRLNPDALSPLEGLFQRFLDSNTPESIQGNMGKLVSPKGQAALASSPDSGITPETPIEVVDTQTGEVVWRGTYAQRVIARKVQDRRDIKYGGYRFRVQLSNSRKTLGSSPDTDPRLVEAFGENFEADEYGLPVIPKTLPEGHPLLQETDQKETATLKADHPLVAVGALPANTPIPRDQFAEAVVEYFLSRGVPLPDGTQPIVFATGGGGGAGKSFILDKLIERGDIDTAGAVLVNADDIKEFIPEYQQIIGLGDGRAAAVTHEESSKISKMLIERLTDPKAKKGFNFVFDATLANGRKSLGMFAEWKTKGFRLHLIGVMIDPKEAMIRASTRAKKKGRWVPNKMLEEAHAGFKRALTDYFDIADALSVFENSGVAPLEALKKSLGEDTISIVNETIWSNIKLDESEIRGEQKPSASTVVDSREIQGDESRGGSDRRSAIRQIQRESGGSESQGAARDQGESGGSLGSSPDSQPDLFGGIEAQITGPRAKAKANMAEALRNAPPKAKAAIAKDIAKREGLQDLDLFAAAAQSSLDAKPRRGDSVPDGSSVTTPGQLGFDFGAAPSAGRNARGTDRAGTIGKPRELPLGDGAPSAASKRRDGGNTAPDSGADVSRPGSGNGSPDGDTAGNGRGSQRGGNEGSGQDLQPRNEQAGKRRAVERERPPEGSPDRNHSIQPGDVLAEGGTVTRMRNNLAALSLLRTLEKENRNATPDEKRTLAKYVGWGGIPQVFDQLAYDKISEIETRRDTVRRYESLSHLRDYLPGQREQLASIEKWAEKWQKPFEEMRETLSNEEWESARDSTINAHYTSPLVIGAMWDGVKRLGFRGGNITEPAGGVGHYFGLMPQEIADISNLYGVELDSVSGRIFGKLYPEADIEVNGFQDTSLPDNSQDLVISNVPFANINIADPVLDAQGAPSFNLHNYFFERSLRLARPGGLVAFITTAHTMDSQIAQRKWLAERSEFVGAIRLPNNAFKGNANTEVVTDIIFLRKPDGTPATWAGSWTSTEAVKTQGGDTANINEWFAEHPEMILGTLAMDGTMYSADKKEMTVHSSGDLAPALERAIQSLPENIITGSATGDVLRKKIDTRKAKPGSFVVDENGGISIKGGSDEINRKDVPMVKSFIRLRDSLNSMYALEGSPDSTDAQLAAARRELNAAYDSHVRFYKNLHLSKTKKILESDPDFYRTLGLEIPIKNKEQKITGYSKADVFSKRVLSPRVEPTTAASTEEAVIASLRWKGRLDPNYVGELLNIPLEEAEARMIAETGAFRDPETGRVDTRERYLSGNVRRKLRTAQLAAATNPAYTENVEALEKMMPQDVPWPDIDVKVGSTWVPTGVYQRFMEERVGIRNVKVLYHKGQGEIIPDSFDVQADAISNKTNLEWGTSRRKATEIMDAALNMREVVIRDSISDGNGGTKSVVNPEDTQKAKLAVEKMVQAFESWLGESTDVQDSLHKIYNETFNSHVVPNYDGSHLQLPWVADAFDLYPSKKHTVWRALQDGNMLVAHGVGGGKTIIGTAIALEMKRLGMANKPLIVVHNATLEQFATTISQMAPTSRVIVARKEDLAGPKRKEFMGRIASGDWDAVVMAQSTFNLIPDNPAWEQKVLGDLASELIQAIKDSGEEPGTEIRKIKDPSVKELVKQLNRLKERMSKLQQRRTDDVLDFQEMGFDALILDEAHKYKKMPFVTKQSNIAGIDTGFSKQGSALLLRTKYIQAKNNGRNVFLMTGTPVTNTLGESWNMVRAVRPDLLKEFSVESFDRFVSTFAKIKTSGELRANGAYKSVSRLSEMANLPEWNRFWQLAADVKMGEEMDVKGRPKVKGGKPELVSVARTAGVDKFVEYIQTVIANFDSMTGKEKRENSHIPLLTYTAARMAAIDMRMIDPNHPDEAGSKTNAALRKVMELYRDTADNQGTQVIFSDSYRPLKTTKLDISAAELEQEQDTADEDADDSEGFNLYHDIREKLIQAGVPREQIGIITEAKGDKARAAMAAAVNEGRIRIIMGSTETLGTGVNMQGKMISAHHLDVPWTPAGLEQRDGRVYRQGNQWANLGTGEIQLLRYGMKDTLDAALWQKLETKERFIKQAISGQNSARTVEDDTGLINLAEQKAILSGADGMLKFEFDEKIRNLSNDFRAWRNRKSDLQRSARSAQSYVDAAGETLPKAEIAAETAKALLMEPDAKPNVSINGSETMEGDKGKELLATAIKERLSQAGKSLNPNQSESVLKPIPFTYNGVELSLVPVEFTENLSGAANPDTRWNGSWKVRHPGMKDFENAMTAQRHPGGIMSEIDKTASRMVTTPESIRRRMREAQEEIDTAETEGKTPFDKLEAFKEAMIGQARIYDRMRLSTPIAAEDYRMILGEDWQKMIAPPSTGRAKGETPANYPGAGLAQAMQTLGSSPAPDLFTATRSPDAREKLGGVKVGTMSALGAYRTLTAKREKVKLTPKEEQQLLDAEVALGQKLAFDMNAVKAKPTIPSSLPPLNPRRPQADIDTDAGLFGSDNSFKADKAGQLALFSSPEQRGVDYSVTKSILDGTYERTEDDDAAIPAFQRAVRQSDDLFRAFGGRPPRNASEGVSRDLRGTQISAAILAELSGKRLVIFTPEGEKSPRGAVVPHLVKSIFVNSESGSVPSIAGHEAWHRLQVDHPYDAFMLGQIIGEHTPAVLIEAAELSFVAKYGIKGATQEVGANIFSSVVTDPLFWREYGTPNSEAIAKQIKAMGGISPYPEARLISDWPAFVKEVARILTREEPTSLFSSPDTEIPNDSAIQAALSSLSPMHRKVFEAVNAGKTPAEVMERYNIPARAVENILNQVRSRITAAMQAEAGTLTPRMKEGKIDGGRPDLALGAKPAVAAIDQIRNESGVPDVRGWAEVNAEADAMLREDYEGTYDKLLDKARNLQPMTDVEVSASKRIIARETMEGRIQTVDERVKIAMMIHGYRDIGTETARSLAIRRDPDMNPAQRHAQFIAEALFSPDPDTRARLRKASPKDQKAILEGWMSKVDGIKEELRARGYDLDASLAAFNERQEEMKEALADSPQVASIIEDSFKKLTRREKTVVEALRPGQTTYEGAAYLIGGTKEDAKEIYTRWVTGIRQAMAESAKRYMAGTLASSPLGNAMADILADLGIADPDMIALDEADRPRVDAEKAKRAPRKPRKPRKPKEPKEAVPATPKEKETKAKAQKILGIPKDKPLTPAQIAAAERFANAEPSTWQAIRQETAKLFPESGGFPADYKAGENDRRIVSGMLMPEAINETTGTFDLNDPIAVKEVMDAFALARGTKMDALMEFWRMSILSGPQTALVNVTSNTMNAAYNLLPRRAVQATVNSVLGLVGQGDKDSASFGEFIPMARNLRKGFKIAALNALRSWKLETRVFEAYAEAKPLQLDFSGVKGEYIPPALGGKFGKIMRSLSFRHMTAADEFMKSLYAQMEAAAQAHRIAKGENLKGVEYDKRLNALMEPGSIAWIRAMGEAKRITFQEDIDGTALPMIRRMDAIADIAKKSRNIPWLGRPLTFFLPFIDTPLNIFKEAVEITPIGGFLAVVDAARALRRRIYAGSISKEAAKEEAELLYNRARLVRDISNQTIGLMVYMVVSSMVEGDDEDEDKRPFITGSMPWKSTEKGERDNAYAVMPPQSIRIGGVVFSYKRMDPFATVMASLADLSLSINRNGGLKPAVFSQWMAGFKDQLSDKTFLTGLSNMAEAWQNPDRFGTRLISNIATGFIPNIIRQPIREADSYLREQKPAADDGFFTAVGKSIGYSVLPQMAPPKIDVWGNPIRTNRGEKIGGTAATDALFRVVDFTNLTANADIDPIDLWIFRHNQETPDSSDRVAITPLPNTIRFTVPGEKQQRTITLSNEEWIEANTRAGKAARAYLGDGWESRPRSVETKEYIEKTYREFQSQERQRLKMTKVSQGLPPLE